MKAIIARTPGAPRGIEYGDWPDPVLAPGEVVVSVKAAACNHADLWLRKGMLGPLPMVLGIDAAGIVSDKATDVPGLPIGTRVMLNPVISCEACAFCDSGEHGLCRQRRALGQYVDGSFAQFVKIPWRNAIPISDNLSFVEAAAVPSVFFTAWALLTRRAPVSAQDTVLVMAAGSGMGTAAIQIAKLLGSRVIAAAGSEAKLDCARALGADETINYEREDWLERTLELSGGTGVQVVLDLVGAAYWPGYMRCLATAGRLVPISFIAGNHPSIDIEQLIRRQISIVGSGPQGSRQVARTVVDLVNRGRLRGIVDRTYPLHEAARAHAAMQQRSVIGKIVLMPD